MKYRKIHPQFVDTFAYYASIPDTIRECLWNYLAYGLLPGSFMEAVLANNFMLASARADYTWNGKSFRDLAMWIVRYAPVDSYGSIEKVECWTGMSSEERLEIMIELKLRPSVIDILKGAEA